MGNEKKLAKAVSTNSARAAYYGNPYTDTPHEVPTALGDVNGWFGTPLYLPSSISLEGVPRTYKEEIQQCRYFYRYDPITATVINRMVDMAVTNLINKRGRSNDEEMLYFNSIADELFPVLQSAAMEYLLTGMAILEYGTKRVMGQKIDPDLGRTRYTIPDSMWVRNPENITLKRVPGSMKRQVFINIPDEERYFIMNDGVRSDGSEDREAYQTLVAQFPEYVRKVRDDQVHTIELPNARPILRRLMPTADYPQSYLVPALAPLKHKQRIKQMDYSIATKAIEAVMLINAGNDNYPVTDDDTTLEDIRTQMTNNVRTAENIYRLFANHTVKISWIYPPLDALLSDVKYNEPNAEIFMAMGFSRVLLTGEAGKSNAGSSVSSTMGAIATLSEMRGNLLRWVKELYKDMAEENGFKYVPEPMFSTIAAADTVALAQYAIEAVKLGALSKNTISRMFGTDFETEHQQIEAEADISGNTPAFNALFDKPNSTPGPVSIPVPGAGTAPAPSPVNVANAPSVDIPA